MNKAFLHFSVIFLGLHFFPDFREHCVLCKGVLVVVGVVSCFFQFQQLRLGEAGEVCRLTIDRAESRALHLPMNINAIYLYYFFGRARKFLYTTTTAPLQPMLYYLYIYKFKQTKAFYWMKSNKSISRKIFLTKSIFCHFKNGQKSIFELGKSLKLNIFHEN